MGRSRRARVLGVVLLAIGTAAGILVLALLARPAALATVHPDPLIALALLTMLIAFGYANTLLD